MELLCNRDTYLQVRCYRDASDFCPTASAVNNQLTYFQTEQRC